MVVAGSNGNGSDDNSDYGWDLSLDEHVHQLISFEAAAPTPTTHSQHEDDSGSHGLAAPAKLEAVAEPGSSAGPCVLVDVEQGGVDIVCSDLTYTLTDLATSPPDAQLAAATSPDQQLLSPLARFRTAPRKPLSVSDLTAGAWCELQYEYTLTRLPGGRRTRTAAMRAGTKVHARLEEEVHTTVRVEVASREDMQGLKLWNMIQGVRTLRETGLTRELDVWGVVDGQVVSGIIDAISYRCPDPNLEAEAEAAASATTTTTTTTTTTGSGAGAIARTGGKKKKYQKRGERKEEEHTAKITDFFTSPPRPSRPSEKSSQSPSEPSSEPHRKAYITDIKTRGSSRLPSGAAVRPTKIQLLLYHRFLADMAAGRLDYVFVFQRYSLDPDEPFSDAFIAQMGGLHDEMFYDAESAPTTPTNKGTEDADDADDAEDAENDATVPDTNTDTALVAEPDIIRYRTLRSLAQLLQDELALTFPHGADSLGRLVAAEYRLRPLKRRRRVTARQESALAGCGSEDSEENDGDSNDDSDGDYGEASGSCIGTNVMLVDEAVLDRYLSRYLEWWRGLRPAAGVDIEEASLKCGHCEFAADCGWRSALDEERVRRVREKLGGRP